MRDTLHDHRLNPRDPRNTFQGFPILTDQITRDGLSVVWRELEMLLQRKTPGNIVEFGCYAGTTSVFIRRLLDAHPDLTRSFHVYDSFEGLPDKSVQDANAAGIDFEGGKLYISKADFIKTFRTSHLVLPVVHKGWFNQLGPNDIPNDIAFAFLDGDFYASILDSLRLIWPKMAPHGVVLVDDYKRETLPGVEAALRDFFQNKPLTIASEHNIAIIRT